MKILAVLCQDPYAWHDGGTFAVRATLEKLAENAEVCVTGFGEGFNAAYVGPYRSVGSLGRVCNSKIKFLLSLLRGKSYSVSKYTSREACKKITRIVTEGHYSIIWCEKLVASCPVLCSRALWQENTSPKIILRTHNVEYLLVKDRFEHKSAIGRILVSLECNFLKEYESMIPELVDQVFCISNEDTRAYRALQSSYAHKVDFLPVTIKPLSLENLSTVADRDFVLFVGDCEWLPNKKAASWILQDLAPLMAKEIPELRIKLVGRGTNSLQHGVGNVDLMGFVDSLEAEYAKALCSIAPVSIGSGVNIKVIESLAHGVPVVGTRFAKRGINTAAYSVAETAYEFIEIIKNIRKSADRSVLADIARREIMKNDHFFDAVWSRCKNRIKA